MILLFLNTVTFIVQWIFISVHNWAVQEKAKIEEGHSVTQRQSQHWKLGFLTHPGSFT